MLEVAFIQLATALVLALARAEDNGAPSADFRVDPVLADLTALISKEKPSAFKTLTADLVGPLWSACRAIELPPEQSEQHITALARLLADDRIRQTASQTPFADRLFDATDAAERAEAIVRNGPDHIDPDQHDPAVLSFLLETTLRALAEADLETKTSLVETARNYLSDNRETASHPSAGPATEEPPPDNEPEPKSQSEPSAVDPGLANTLGKIERAEALGIGVPSLEVILVGLINTTRSPDISNEDLLSVSARARKVDDQISRLVGRHDLAPTLTEQIRSAFRSGRLDDCARHLATAEESAVRTAISMAASGPGHAPPAAELRGLRAQIAELRGQFRTAARHYGFAERHIPRKAFDARCTAAANEARTYELAAFRDGATGNLDKSAATLTRAISSLPEKTRPDLRATLQVDLAHALILLGRRDKAPERFDIASQILADAEATFKEQIGGISEGTEEQTDNDKRIAAYAHDCVCLRASALDWLARRHASPELAGQACQNLQDLLDPRQPYRPAEPNDWRGVSAFPRAQLAIALCTYASLTAAERLYSAAIETLKTDLADLTAAATQTPIDASGYCAALRASDAHGALETWHSRNDSDAPEAIHHKLEAECLLERISFGPTARGGRPDCIDAA